MRLSSAFASAERAGGSPVELYTFIRGTDTWHYTSADRAQTIDGIDYAPAVIARKPVEQKNDTGGEQVVVTVSLETPFGQALLDPGFQRVACHIRRTQPDSEPVTLVLLGAVIATSFADNLATLTVATVEHLFKTPIPRVLISRTCPYALYSTSCGVNKDDFAIETTIASFTRGASESTITLTDAQANGVLNNGMIHLASGQVVFIAKNVGAVCTIWGRLPADVADDDAIVVYRGCDKTFATCESVFDNASNFGGFPNLPDRNANVGTMR